ncbi:MAG: tetratricopeptide repeat protein [Anaerolineae bacterium]|jgi:tetratricopeptide (TPR) repeat protein|nr:tetratricopeptide repeat protein [Anaerolineae bacterium]MBT7071025.1 tetratricopeptide repeat protein [Anaerolineae bacterium]MBT7323731.1 tetratricopeptide repeat protein [Anaerolineae bacterium]
MTGREDLFQKAMNDGHSAAWDQLWSKAATSYRAALTEMPDHPKALSSLGLALYQMQEFEEALQIYRRLSEISPNDPIPFEKIAQLCERLGELKEAVEAAIKAADLYIEQKDVEKAIENWSRVTQLNPEHILAHSRLALVHERLGHQQQAVTEYLALASLMQRSGKPDKATELVMRALKIIPGSQTAQQAQALLNTGQLLPKPIRPKGGTGPIRIAQVKQLGKPKKEISSTLDPIGEASRRALMILAEILFEYSDDSDPQQVKKGLQAIMHGTGQLSVQRVAQTKIIMHLGQAIDAQSKKQDELAADELAHALLAGFEHPALYFDLGMLRSKGDRVESAMRHLQHAVKHADFGLAARLIMGSILKNLGRLSEAATEYLEALKLADVMLVPEDQVDALRQLYEPLIEAQAGEEDEVVHMRLCDNVEEMIVRVDWREHLRIAREELPKSDGEVPLPLAEILIQAQSGQVLGAMARVHELVRQGHMRSAMDEAFQAITYAPTYLPLHSLIGDLLIQDDQTEDAIAKYDMIAEAYNVRGEANQSTVFLRKIIKLAPMDLSSRTKLIDQLIARGQVDDAIREYINLADIYYRLAELDMARKTYTTALRAAQRGNAERSWNVHILQRMADIDMQRLDWKRALRVFEQIRTLRPDDIGVRKSLIDLNLKMANKAQAFKELNNFLGYLEEHPSAESDVVALLAGLLTDHPTIGELHQTLAEQYRTQGKKEDAIKKFDRAADVFLQAGEKESAIQAITMLLSMAPPNIEDYQQILAEIQAE